MGTVKCLTPQAVLRIWWNDDRGSVPDTWQKSGSVGRDGAPGHAGQGSNITSRELLLGSSKDLTLASRDSDQRYRAEAPASVGPPGGVDKAWTGSLTECTQGCSLKGERASHQ